MINESNDKNNFPHKLLLTNKKVSKLRKAFANNLSTDIESSKTQLSTIVQSGGFVSRFPGPLLRTGVSLIKNVLTLLAKIVLTPLGLKASASASDIGIHKKFLQWG